jgi:hypothetical protein
MKRCPQCNRVEPDDALAFCRADGSPLSVDTTNEELGTIRLGSTPVIDEAKTTLLTPAITNNGFSASPGPTTVLPSSGSQPLGVQKPRRTFFRYKGKETSPQIIGKDLNVQAILNGRVVQRGDQLTLGLELIDAKTENVIWSENYVRREADLITLQSEVSAPNITI